MNLIVLNNQKLNQKLKQKSSQKLRETISFMGLSLITVFFIVFIIDPSLKAERAYYQHHAKGWHWYEVQESEDGSQESVKEDNQKTPTQPESPKTASEVVADYRKELENRLAKAWINPSPRNIMRYQEMQKDMLDRSQTFSQRWMHSVFLNPELDNTISAPVNQQARHVYYDIEREKVKETIGALSKEYGLFFFFSGNCEYCHQFAPIVRRFSEQYGWEVLAISLDGGKLAQFPNAQPDNGLFEQWQQGQKGQVIPALYAVNPNTGHVIPIAFGMTGIDEMETRIMTIVKGVNQ